MISEMTPKQAAIAAFELREPVGLVPHFELQFQLAHDLLGERHVSDQELDAASGAERDRLIHENAELYVREAERLDYCIVPINMGPGRADAFVETIRLVHEMIGDERLIAVMADPTMSIPNGANMMDLVISLAERPDEIKAGLRQGVLADLERVKPLRDAGASVALMCADYCFNDGPFLSPAMFREFVTPYLAEAIEGLREQGFYAVKQTDGDIMPILDQLVECRPHAIHSLDPMAGVDLKRIKREIGGKVALCGNVNCALMQTGPIEAIRADSVRALRDGMPGGGFFYCSSNTPFVGMPIENYLAILDVRAEFGRYPIEPDRSARAESKYLEQGDMSW